MRTHIKLSDHTFKKGKFITPINSLPMMQEFEDEKSWPYGRMPEYLWIGLILKYYGREDGLRKSYDIISTLHKLAPDLNTARLSQVIKLDAEVQKRFYDFIVCIGAKETLAPLTIFLTASKAPVFAECFYCPDQSIENRCKAIIDVMRDIMGHQTNESTDIRFVALYFYLLSGKMHLPKDQVDSLTSYPKHKHTDEIMRMIRPSVRSLESMILTFQNADSDYLKNFWRCISEMTDCSTFVIEFPDEQRNITSYMENLHEVFTYLSELFVATDSLNEKMNVLLGIATYSYKRLFRFLNYATKAQNGSSFKIMDTAGDVFLSGDNITFDEAIEDEGVEFLTKLRKIEKTYDVLFQCPKDTAESRKVDILHDLIERGYTKEFRAIPGFDTYSTDKKQLMKIGLRSLTNKPVYIFHKGTFRCKLYGNDFSLGNIIVLMGPYSAKGSKAIQKSLTFIADDQRKITLKLCDNSICYLITDEQQADVREILKNIRECVQVDKMNCVWDFIYEDSAGN